MQAIVGEQEANSAHKGAGLSLPSLKSLKSQSRSQFSYTRLFLDELLFLIPENCANPRVLSQIQLFT
jgi:hypothetical protein